MLTRRSFVAGGACGCLFCGASAAWARISPSTVHSLVVPGYRPTDPDEKGLWQTCDRIEEELASSNLLMRAPDLAAYTKQVVERLLGPKARDVRPYLVHDPAFNASMAPNGMMIIHSGLLARVRNEAQFAAVLGHEAGHYFRKHSLQGWRDQKTKTGIMAFVSVGAGVAAGAAAAGGNSAQTWIDLANSINSVILLSLFSFSREQESEADAFGVKLMDDARYKPTAAAEMWRQFVEERKASAAQRKKKYRDGSASAFSTHPPTEARMLDLTASAQEVETITVTGKRYDDGRAAWQTAIAPHRAALLDEQVKLNDPGASLYLVNALAQDGWNGVLHYHAGEIYRLRDEPGDAARAAEAYAAAAASADAPPEAWRAHGYALLKGGRPEEGRRALARYLEAKPDAKDAAMVRFSIGQ